MEPVSAVAASSDDEGSSDAEPSPPRRRPPRRPPPPVQLPGRDALRQFHEFSKRMKLDAGLTIKTIAGGDVVELDDLLSDSESSDGVSENEFEVDPEAALGPDCGDESHIDPETGDIVTPRPPPDPAPPPAEPNEDEVASSSSTPSALTEKLKEMAEISVKPVRRDDETPSETKEDEDEKSKAALNVRRNIREVMDEKQLDESTLAAQRQESERLARVQEQQRIIREVRRQIALGRQDKTQARVLQLLQGRTGSSVLKKSPEIMSPANQKMNFSSSMLMKLPSGNLTPSVSIAPVSGSSKLDISKITPTIKKDVVEIVDSSSTSSSSESAPSSDSDDCIMLSDSELPPSPEPEDDPQNSGLHVNDAYNIPDEQGRVVINIGHPENEEDIFLAPQIGRIIKPHQIGGVRFLFDNIIESVERFSTSTGFGCILAHSMGLGKTLQIVCFCDIFLRHTNSKTVLCIMPINTLQNWVAEFNMWLPLDAANSPLNANGDVRPRNFPIYVLNDSHKTLQARAKVIKEWNEIGGVLMIGYELYRLLSLKKNKKPRNRKKKNDNSKLASETKDKVPDILDDIDIDKQNAISRAAGLLDIGDFNSNNSNSINMTDSSKLENLDRTDSKEKTKDDFHMDKKDDDDDTDEEKKLLEEMYMALVKPGPDLVICDEGHRIKNSHSNISNALKQMRTKRRIVLTGYPLQNNLLEYWCMVDFVRPNYLGTKTEFSNMFERPIQNGQCIDSTPQDIRLMRYRAHVLHSLLVGFVQRRSHSVLQSTLPQKEEYVLLVRMTSLQRKLYDTFMNDVVRVKTVPNPLKAFAVCCKIWNHPDVLFYFLKKRSEMAAVVDYDLEIEDNPNLNEKNQGPNKKGKKAKTPAKKKEKAPLATTTNDGKPAATIPPNTSNANSVFPFDSSKPSNVSNGTSNFGSGLSGPPATPGPPGPPTTSGLSGPSGAPGPGPYPNAQTDSKPNFGQSSNHQQNHYQPYQNYQHYSQNNYFNQNGSYDSSFSNNYYPNPPYNNEYNNYNVQSGQAPAENSGSVHQANPQYNQGYWGNDGNYYNSNSGFYPNNQNNYQNQDHYNNMYDPFSQQNSSYPEYNQNRSYNNPSNVDNSPNFSAPIQENRAETFQPPQTNQIQNTFMSSQSLPAPETNNFSETPYSNFQNNSAAPPPQTDNKPNIDEISTLCWPIQSDDNVKQEITDPPVHPHLLDIKNSDSKADSDNEIKIADLDTKKVIINEKCKLIDEIKKEEKCDTAEIKSECDTSLKPEKIESTSTADQFDDKNKLMESKPKGKLDNKKTKEKSKAKDKKSKASKDGKDKKGKDDKDLSDVDSDIELEKKEETDKKHEFRDEVSYDWAIEFMKNYVPGIIENSAKMEIFFCILEESIRLGDRILLFSQSLFTLNLIEDFLQRNHIPGLEQCWMKNKSYFRLDGSTSALEREKLINEFNLNSNIHLFLVSTRAGSLGINLVGANRVIVFDASWNPCHDTQAVCRVYRYGQQKPCFVYRLVMDYCLEKKIYDRQINKQGMADRVVDECNPDAVLSMKEVTNLCWDNDEKEPAPAEFTDDCKEKYVDLIVQKIISHHAKTLSKEPFQHESLLVDRKEKKLSSAEKRLAQRGYELEKKAAANPKPNLMYRTIRAADGTLIQRPVASVRPMQHGANTGGTRWIPAEVWQRQGMTAQEMTLPLDVVIPTNSSEKSSIVLKAGQKVMVLKSPKGIYMQLETGKIIAIKTSFKVGQNKPVEAKEIPKKITPVRPTNVNLPGSLKNNSAITVISKSTRGGMQKILTRPPILTKKTGTPIRPLVAGPRMMDPKSRQLNPNIQMRAFSLMRGGGRGPIPRSSRPIPIQNNLNIKIQGPSVHPIDNPDSEKEFSDLEYDQIENSDFSTNKEIENDISKIETNVSESISDKEQDINLESNEIMNSETASENQPPSLTDDMISEDSSQEKTYVDLSDTNESKTMTKAINKSNCNIQIKNNRLVSSNVDAASFGSDITIKRMSSTPSTTSILSPGMSRDRQMNSPHVSESRTPEGMLDEYKQSVSQGSFSSDENNAYDGDVSIKEKKIYRPNIIERFSKTNSLKNYRHQKFNQRPIPIHNSEFHLSKTSPGSTSSTPTPPPISNPIAQLCSKILPEKFVSSISQLEKTASSINPIPKKGGISDFQQSLSDITRTYPTNSDAHQPEIYKPGPKSKKKKNVAQPRIESNLNDNEPPERLEPKPISSSNEHLPHISSSSIPNNQLPNPNQPYTSLPNPVAMAPGYTDPIYQQQQQQQQQAPVNESILPQQPYNSYPGYPPTGGAYPPYPHPPYYQPYPPTAYPTYPQYPVPPAPYPPGPYQHNPYPTYPAYPNPNSHPW